MDEYYENELKFNAKKNQLREAKEKFAANELKRIIKTSLETTSIGALSSFERAFGDLFGYNKKYTELSQAEKELKNKWLDVREEILRRCANGIRLSFNAVDKCSIQNYAGKKYHTVIKNKNNEK